MYISHSDYHTKHNYRTVCIKSLLDIDATLMQCATAAKSPKYSVMPLAVDVERSLREARANARPK